MPCKRDEPPSDVEKPEKKQKTSSGPSSSTNPTLREFAISCWRELLPPGNDPNNIPEKIEEVPWEYWYGDQHQEGCTCTWCAVLYGSVEISTVE